MEQLEEMDITMIIHYMDMGKRFYFTLKKQI